MSLHSPLKLFVGGCSMITSCSIWLFEPSNNPQVASLTLDDSASSKPIKLDTLPAVEKLKDWQGQPIKDANIEVVNFTNGSSITLGFKDESSRAKATLNVVNVDLESFYVYGNSTKDQYQAFDRKNIKIGIFKKSAWRSDSKKEEYEALSDSQIEELFQGNEEVRVKQLLLALHHKIEWLSYGTDLYYMNKAFAKTLNDLKDLKIRHFNDFNRLKEYVKKKSATCVDDTKACYPHLEEVDYLEMDRKEYFDNAWNKQNT